MTDIARLNNIAREIYDDFGNDAASLEQAILQRATGADHAQGSEYSLSELIFAYANLTGSVPEFDPPAAYDHLWQDDETFAMLGQLDQNVYRGVGELVANRRNELSRIRQDLEGADDEAKSIFDEFDELDDLLTGGDGTPANGISLLDAHQLRELVSLLLKSGRGYAALLQIGNFSRMPRSANYQARLLDKHEAMMRQKDKAIKMMEDAEEDTAEGQAQYREAQNILNQINASSKILESVLEMLENEDQQFIRMVSDRMQSSHQNISSIQQRMA